MDDLISEFITETSESLALLDSELVRLEQNPEDKGILGNIFRIMHTIKGTCGFLGLPRLEHVAHAGENVLGKIRDGVFTATPEAVTMILESLDCIKGLIEYLSSHGEEQVGDDSALIAKLDLFSETGSLAGAVAPAMVVNGSAHVNGAANGAVSVSENPFPHFRGDDELEVAAAAAMMAEMEKPAPPALVVAHEIPVAKPAPVSAPAKAAEESGEAKEGAVGQQSIRVNLDVLENLMQMVSELVLTRNQLLQIARTKEDKDFITPLQQLSHITSELQEGVMKTRMQPIGNAWSKFPRLIRDLSLELGKKIDLRMIGAETELDRQLLEVIKDPLTHMVRNSCDHGLEKPADRKAAGKQETGTVTLSAYHEGGHIIIEIIDDGRGINIERVKQKAVASGIATEAQLAAMTEKQIAQYIFAPGFSTAEAVTSVSGRGVGMDVVKTNIEKIGGTIDLDSNWGKGSKVAIKIPLTLAIVSVLIVEAQEQKFAIPQINVSELVRVAPKSGLEIETINEALVLRLRDKLLPLAVLSEVLGSSCSHSALMGKDMYVAVCNVGNCDFGILVDRVYDTEEIVVKPVAEILKIISIYSGNTILGDGSVILILDPNGIAKTIGNMDFTRRDQSLADTRIAESERLVGFLSFSIGKGAPKAVPLELVSRLEEIDALDVECAGDHPVVQYRGDLMRLITLDSAFEIPKEGKMDVVVFNYDKKVMGLVVSEILDIVYAPFDIKLTSKEVKSQGYLGSMIISGKPTDIVDVSHLLSDVVGQSMPTAGHIDRAQAESSNILLVEDSPFFRNLTVPFLASVGYHVTATEDAKEALGLLTDGRHHFDMIVTDIEMPGMNGFEFTTACRNNPGINGIPIVAYTSTLSAEVMQKSRDVGMNDCIVKTDRPGLLETVSRCLFQSKESVA